MSDVSASRCSADCWRLRAATAEVAARLQVDYADDAGMRGRLRNLTGCSRGALPA